MSIKVAITSLTVVTSLAAAAIIPIVQDGQTQRTTVAELQFQQNTGVPLDKYGEVDRSGVEPMADLIESAVSAAAAAGLTLVLSDGDYLLDHQIDLVDNAKIRLMPNARLIRGFSGGAILGQASYDPPLTGVDIEGGQLVNPDPDVWTTGRHISLWMNDSSLKNIFLDKHNNAGVAFILYGDRNTIEKIRHVEPTHTGGGMAVHAAQRNKISNCYMECDDDCFQFGSTTVSTNTGFGYDVIGNQYVNCNGVSRSGRLMIVGVGLGSLTELKTTSKLIDNSFVGVKGKGKLAITILNNASSGEVARNKFFGCEVDCSVTASATGNGLIDFFVDNGSGGIDGTEFHGLTLKGGNDQTVDLGTSTTNTLFVGGYLGAPLGSDHTVIVGDGCRVTFMGTTIMGRAGTDNMQIGSAQNDAEVILSGCNFREIGDGRAGVRVFGSKSVYVGGGTKFAQVSGASTGKSLVVTDGARGVIVGDCDYSGVLAADKITWPTSAQNSGCKIGRFRTQIFTGTTTMRASDSGTSYILTGSTNRTITLPVSGFDLEMRAYQGGSGLVKLQAQTGETIQVGTSITAAGGTVESTAMGDSIWLLGLGQGQWLATSKVGTWTVT